METLYDSEFELPRNWTEKDDEEAVLENYELSGEEFIAFALDEIAGYQSAICHQLGRILDHFIDRRIVEGLTAKARADLILEVMPDGGDADELHESREAVRQVERAVAFSDRILKNFALRRPEVWLFELGTSRDYLFCTNEGLLDAAKFLEENRGRKNPSEGSSPSGDVESSELGEDSSNPSDEGQGGEVR